MYTCPTDDIHSIYADGELPPTYITEYELHIQKCPSCSEKLKKIQSIRQSFSKNKAAIILDSNFLNQSFERLQTKMRYAKNTKNSNIYSSPEMIAKWSIGVAAAITIIALPAALNRTNKDGINMQLASISSSKELPSTNQNIVISGNINRDFAVNVSTKNKTPDMSEIEVFRPTFSTQNKIHLQISIPGFEEDVHDAIEIALPSNTISGQLK